MDYGVYGVDCDRCGKDQNHRTENCIALFYKQRPSISARTMTLEESSEFCRTNPEFLALRARAEADEARWMEMTVERELAFAELQKHYQQGARRHGVLTVHTASTLGEMISILQRLSNVTDISVGSVDTGGYRLETYQCPTQETC